MKWYGWLLAVILLALCVAEGIWLFILLFDGSDAFPTSEDRRTGIWVALAGALMLYGGFWSLRRLRGTQNQSGPHINRKLERRILDYARRSGGRLTVAEVALNARCTVQEADDALRELLRQGVATVGYTPNMEAVYIIGGFDEQAQAQAQDALNKP